MKSLLIALLYTALSSATPADATNEVQSDQGPSSTAAHGLVNLFTELVSSIRDHVMEDQEFEQDFLQKYFVRFISQMIPLVEKELVDPIEEKLPRMILKTFFSILSPLLKQAEKISGEFKEVPHPSHQLKQTRFLNELKAAIIQVLSSHEEQNW